MNVAGSIPEASARLGRYRLVRRIASGGMGEVYLARQEGPAGFAKTLVVKRLLPHLASDEKLRELFLNEARLAALLSHPNVVQIFELGEVDGAFFIAMEHIHGRSLREISRALKARNLPFPPLLAARICAQALHGLHHAHTLRDDQGRLLTIIHRDVSPENILISFSGAVKVVDFGIAKAAQATTETTRRLRGKILYMAPEQLKGSRVDARSDVFGMGVVLYELLTGERPFEGRPATEILDHVQQGVPRLTSAQEQALPPLFQGVVARALATTPEARFGSADEMANVLAGFAARDGSVQTPGQLGSFLMDLFGAEPPLAEAPAAQSTRQLEGVAEAVTVLATPPDLFQRRAKSRRWRFAAAGAALGALAFFWWARSRTSSTPPVAAVTTPQLEPPVEPFAAPKVEPAEDLAFTEPRPPAPERVSARPRHLPAVGRVVVRVYPWAEVLVSGKRLGTTPLPAFSLPAGRQLIILRNPELQVERQVVVRVQAGAEVTVTANLMEEAQSARPGTESR